jgi:hypothetical protein
MTLRCKVGDVVLVLRGSHSGRFATVLARYVGVATDADKGNLTTCDGWLIEYQHNSRPRPGGYCQDDINLLPIRPDLNEPSLELELMLDRLIVQGKELKCST